MSVDLNSEIEIIPKNQYVSRGGLKLERAFKDLKLCIKGKKAVDIGSSTGGFTDFLLKNGADKIIDIDVGYGQLCWELRNSPHIILFERTNVRHFDTSRVPFVSDFTVVDVSFISIKKIFGKILELTKENGEILLLIKPQFELKKKEVESKGIIRDRKLHLKVLLDMAKFIENYPVRICNFTFSKLKGSKGNIEFWIFLEKCSEQAKSVINYDKIIKNTVSNAHIYFNHKQAVIE